MALATHLDTPVYSQPVGPVSAQVFLIEGVYQVFIMGDNLTSYLGASTSLDDCKEEIRTLQRLAESPAYQREVALLTSQAQ